MNEEQIDTQLRVDYRTWAGGPVHADLTGYIEQQREASLNRAEEEPEPLKAIAYLQNAQAYKTIKEYIRRMTEPE